MVGRMDKRMTREETVKILMNIECSYANWKPSADRGFMVDVWCDDLSEYTYEQVYTALKAYKATNTSGFAPNVGQLIEMIHGLNPENHNRMNEAEAWALVYKAICNSNYHAEEEFNKLPALVQKAVGSPDSLKSLAGSSDFNEEVEKSLFMRTYNTICKRAEEDKRLPEPIRQMLGNSGNAMLEANYENEESERSRICNKG